MTITRYAVGDKVVITAATLQIMRNSNHSCVHPLYPSDDFIAKAGACLGVVGEVTHTFPPGYEVSARFGDQGFHMKDNWIERAPVRFVCHRNGADTGLFTDGKAYEAKPIGSGAVFEVVDDSGITRVISPGPRCPHLVRRVNPDPQRRSWFERQDPVGEWEPVDGART